MDRSSFAMLALAAALAGCATPSTSPAHDAFADGATATSVPIDVPEIPELAGLDAELSPDAPRSIREAREEFEDRRRVLTRRREDQQERSRELKLTREEATLRRDIALTESARTVENARRELRLAQENLTHFRDVGRQTRREKESLSLRRTADALSDTREELAQLELMYGDELGDATAEIVLERTRRRLELAELAHGLAQETFVEIEQRELPREDERLAALVADAELALANAERNASASELTHNAKLREVLVGERELSREAEDLQVELTRLETDIAEWELERDDA